MVLLTMCCFLCDLLTDSVYCTNSDVTYFILQVFRTIYEGPSWPWSYGRIYNYLCNQCLSPLMLWVGISIRARCTTLCDKDCQWLETGRWFSPGTPVSSTNKTDRHDITEILLKVALDTFKQTNKKQTYVLWQNCLYYISFRIDIRCYMKVFFV